MIGTYRKGGTTINTTEKKLMRATKSLADMVWREARRMKKSSSFNSKEVKELAQSIKELCTISKMREEDTERGEVRVVFEGGEAKWAQ